MQNFLLINDRANYVLYLVRDMSTAPKPNGGIVPSGARGMEQELIKMAQQWLIEHGVITSCGPYASDIAVLLTTNGVCPVKGYDDRDKYELRGSIAYAEFGGPMPTPSQRKKMNADYHRGASRGEALGIVKVSHGDDDIDDHNPQSWFTGISDTLDVVI